MHTLQTDFPAWRTGTLQSVQTPQEQLGVILSKWISGSDIPYARGLSDLMPRSSEVWELKTADLRIFGWLYRPRVFIAVSLEYADWYKGRNPRRSYEDARDIVIRERETIDLDMPRFAAGTYDELV
jgi:hypothetical protein